MGQKCEYINKQALQTRLERKKCGPANKRYTEGWNDAVAVFKSLVHGAKAEDVAPVKHGAWVWNEQWELDVPNHNSELITCGWRCSNCGIDLGEYLTESTGEAHYIDNEFVKPKLNSCPKCGAVMEIDKMDDICDTCAFEDACPSAHFHPTDRYICADYKSMKKGTKERDAD